MACGCCGGSCTCDEHEAHRGFLERVLEGFESWPALAVALVCLVASFVLVGQGCGHEAATAVPDHEGWRHWVDVLNPAYVSLVDNVAKSGMRSWWCVAIIAPPGP